MHSIDSDSSDDDSAYNTTNVMLGYASKDPTDDDFSQLGGFPTWPEPHHPPSADLAKCQTCKNMMCLLLQLDCDLPDKFPQHERRLYIFACRNKPCRRKAGAVRALRGTKISPLKSKANVGNTSARVHLSEGAPAAKAPSLGDSIFASHKGPSPSSNVLSTDRNSYPNPFASPTSASPLLSSQQTSETPATRQAQADPAVDLSGTFAEKSRLSSEPSEHNPKTPWPKEASLPKAYSSYHLDAELESLEPASLMPSASSATQLNAATGGSTQIDEQDDRAANMASAFESTIDRTFQRFADRLAQNPDQVLRYEYGGQPLLYAADDQVGRQLSARNPHHLRNSESKVTTQAQSRPPASIESISPLKLPPCERCGTRREFELQLVPQAIAELETKETDLDGMEWGTIIAAVCGRDCASDGTGSGKWWFGEEWVGVQWEEKRNPAKS